MFRSGISIGLEVQIYDATAHLDKEHGVTSVVDVAFLPEAIGGNKHIDKGKSKGEGDFLEECRTEVVSMDEEDDFGGEHPTISKFVQELKFLEGRSRSQS